MAEEPPALKPKTSFTLTDELYAYILRVSSREPEVVQRLRAETAPLPGARMQIPVEQGNLLALLVQLMGARKTLDIGVFTGCSSLVVALALPPDGKVIACDVSEEWTAIARRYWQAAGVAHKIDLRLAPAVETLRGLLAAGQAGTFDFAFIDADKENYDNYYELALQLLRPGGLIALDNMLWSGRIADPNVQDPNTVALRQLSAKIHADTRVSIALLPVADGITLALKR